MSLLIALQWPLWFGKGSVFRVMQLERQLTDQIRVVQQMQERNMAMAEEVRNLKTGNDALEERVRTELGMIHQGEIFFQILDKPDHSTVSFPMQVEH